MPTLPAFKYNVLATAPAFTDVNGTTEFCVRVKFAPGAMLVMTGLVMVGALLKTKTPEEEPVSSLMTPANSADVVAAKLDNLLDVYATVPPVPKAIDDESVPVNVRVLLAVNTLLLAMVKVPVLDVRVSPLMLVAVATPRTGVTSVGDVFITKVVPVPVCEATLVALPTDVIGPVRFAFVVTVPALPLTFPVTFPVSGPENPAADKIFVVSLKEKFALSCAKPEAP